MVLAGDTLFLAGPPNEGTPKARIAAIGAAEGGMLVALDARDGTKRSEQELSCQPVFDGLAAANERLYLVTTGGQVACLE